MEKNTFAKVWTFLTQTPQGQRLYRVLDRVVQYELPQDEQNEMRKYLVKPRAEFGGKTIVDLIASQRSEEVLTFLQYLLPSSCLMKKEGEEPRETIDSNHSEQNTNNDKGDSK